MTDLAPATSLHRPSAGRGPDDQPAGPNRFRHPLTDRLDREWARLRHDRRSLARVAGWDLPWAAGDRALNDLDAVLALTDRDDQTRSDAAMAELLRRADDDPLASTIVLRRLLPGLLLRARRYGWVVDAPVDHLLASACWAIRRFDVSARPRHVVSALLSDAVYLAFRREQRRRSATESPVADEQLAMLPSMAESAALVELADVLRNAAQAGVPARDLELLRELVATDAPAAVAVRRGVTDRTIRNWRAAAVDRVRAAVA